MDDHPGWSSLLEHIETYVEEGLLDEHLGPALRIAQRFKNVRSELVKGREEYWHGNLRVAVEEARGSFVVGDFKDVHLEEILRWEPERTRVALRKLWKVETPLHERVAMFAAHYPYRQEKPWTRVRVISMLLTACGQDHPPLYRELMVNPYSGTGRRIPDGEPEAIIYDDAREFLREVVRKARGAGLARPRSLLEARLAIEDWEPPAVAIDARAERHRRAVPQVLPRAKESTQLPSGEPTAAEPQADRSTSEITSTAKPEQPEHTRPDQDDQDSTRPPRPMNPEDLEKAGRTAQEIGRLGEILLDRHLGRLMEAGKIDDYKWVSNEDHKSPFDFLVLRSNEWEKLEVKSTCGDFEREYLLSRRELREALIGDETYRVARVYALTPETARMRISRPLRNLATSIHAVLDKLPEGVGIDDLRIVPADYLFDAETIVP